MRDKGSDIITVYNSDEELKTRKELETSVQKQKTVGRETKKSNNQIRKLSYHKLSYQG